MRLGMIVAVEMDSIYAYYGDVEKIEKSAGYEVYFTRRGNSELYIINSGVGIAAAAAGTEHLISKYAVEAIINFGVVGGLTEECRKHKICIVKDVVHYRYDSSAFMPVVPAQVIGHDSIHIPTDERLFRKALEICPEMMTATCCSGDVFVDSLEEKQRLSREYGGDICDMESAGIVLTCEADAVPCLLIKAVSDGLAEGAKAFQEELIDAGNLCLEVTDRIIGLL